ncbi:hypothetical protein FPSE_07364 [Fusarium pseudograminearum CS3096]|uniref:NadR/Ttd14 AAA domain-containing protein n=1 Tax=Fusarium pseudograminearum (strain CS3096) TaxID=1028729 RepID=K3VHG2_FUSPC|nr:hypothetical protein FPSE_07364 [Fusarium pseudograminearum CS3096]EKJ72483.1 hypothetical protein FPSE_07364 [Fusarium pseudograminearum CS3096]
MPPNANIPNIYIIGPQSTGKTTLIHKIQDDLQHWLAGTSIESPSIISEVARTLILEAQAVAEKEALQTSSWFISDRSGFDPLVYAKRYVSPQGVQDLQQLPAWIDVKDRMENALIVVCEAGTPWLMDDGVRLMPGSHDEWMAVFDDFFGLLDQVGFEYCIIPRTMLDLSERADFIRMKWNAKRESAVGNDNTGR